MIPLRIRAEAHDATEPFVVRLISQHCTDPSKTDGVLEHADGDRLTYRTAHGVFSLFGVQAQEVESDVLLVIPDRNIAHRLIRAASPHNTFLVTEQCDQLCVMCSQPPKRYHWDLFAHFHQAALLAPQGATIGISGGEPTLYKAELFSMLSDILKARPDLEFHILTNAQHFTDNDRDAFQRIPSRNVVWGVPLYSASAFEHDEIVGKAGAHDRLLRSLCLMCRLGLRIELRTVLMQRNAYLLPDLAQFVSTHLPFVSVWAVMQLENIGYARKNWDGLFFDNSVDFSALGAALDTARARGVSVSLYNFPLCTVPVAYRDLAAASISDWKQKYLAECTDCELKETCGGFFEWYPDQRGFTRLGLS